MLEATEKPFDNTERYRDLGCAIAYYRKRHGMTQEQLAEQVGISVTHMSHIETGNTKLGLSVLVALADALEVQCDDLLREKHFDRHSAENEILELLDCCKGNQLRIMLDILRSTKKALDKYE